MHRRQAGAHVGKGWAGSARAGVGRGLHARAAAHLDFVDVVDGLVKLHGLLVLRNVGVLRACKRQAGAVNSRGCDAAGAGKAYEPGAAMLRSRRLTMGAALPPHWWGPKRRAVAWSPRDAGANVNNPPLTSSMSATSASWIS
jgi:hypothetical protein